MHMLISLNRGGPDSDPISHVLRNIIATIDTNSSGRSVKFVFTDESCYGQIGHYLSNHWDDSWTIFFFGVHGVDHACLYSQDGKPIVDTFSGRVTADGYVTTGHVVYPMLGYIQLSKIRSYIRRFSK
jgi:hypothetical protein